MSSWRVVNIFFLLPCQGFIVVMGNNRELSQHSSDRLTQQLQAGRILPRGSCGFMLLLPKKTKQNTRNAHKKLKEKLMSLKNCGDWRWTLMSVTKTKQIPSGICTNSASHVLLDESLGWELPVFQRMPGHGTQCSVW